jgi:hypothetical protein
VNKTVDNPIKIVDGTPQMSRRRARYRALTVAGQKRVAVGERERRQRRMIFAEIQRIDNEHE